MAWPHSLPVPTTAQCQKQDQTSRPIYSQRPWLLGGARLYLLLTPDEVQETQAPICDLPPEGNLVGQGATLQLGSLIHRCIGRVGVGRVLEGRGFATGCGFGDLAISYCYQSLKEVSVTQIPESTDSRFTPDPWAT